MSRLHHANRGPFMHSLDHIREETGSEIQEEQVCEDEWFTSVKFRGILTLLLSKASPVHPKKMLDFSFKSLCLYYA
jgi:hypothetical protein